jgi:hypothetical protein
MHSTHWSVTEQRLFREKNQLEAVARQLQQDLVPLREEHARLKRKVQAPAQLKVARIEMAALTRSAHGAGPGDQQGQDAADTARCPHRVCRAADHQRHSVHRQPSDQCR